MRVLLLSGGLDSALVLANCGPFDLALTFDYSQPHHAEVEAARKLSRRYNVFHEVVGVTWPTVPTTGLMGGHDHTATASVVPGRNVAFVAMAAMRGASRVVLGCNKDDRLEYHDCRRENLARVAAWCGVVVEVPLQYLTKRDVVREASKIRPGLETVTCYRGTGCGECAACRLIGAVT
jgi:queuosine biosynthesis protein QueC